MKRLALYASVVSMLMSTCVGSILAQTARPNFSKLSEKLEKSDQKTADAKKGLKVGTWLDRAELLTEIAAAHTLNTQAGWDAATVQLVLGKPDSEGQEEINGTKYRVWHYGTVDVYFEADKLAFTKVVQPVVVNPLPLAYAAYMKAESLDVKQKKVKKIADGLEVLRGMMFNEGVNYFKQGQYGKSAESLEQALEVGLHANANLKDTLAAYYAGLARYQNGEKEEALQHFKEAMDMGYTERGNVVCTYYQVAKEAGKIEDGKAMVEANVQKYPGQKCLMLSLVDYYVSQGKDAKESLPYLDRAIAADSANAQLYFVRGVVMQNLNDRDGALASYNKAHELKPDYIDPLYNIAVMYYNAGVEFQKKAIEDSKKYDEYMQAADQEFKKAIPVAEDALKVQENHAETIDILRTLYFKYRSDSSMAEKLKALDAKYPKK